MRRNYKRCVTIHYFLTHLSSLPMLRSNTSPRCLFGFFRQRWLCKVVNRWYDLNIAFLLSQHETVHTADCAPQRAHKHTAVREIQIACVYSCVRRRSSLSSHNLSLALYALYSVSEIEIPCGSGPAVCGVADEVCVSCHTWVRAPGVCTSGCSFILAKMWFIELLRINQRYRRTTATP
jgi:hypothetical protein